MDVRILLVSMVLMSSLTSGVAQAQKKAPSLKNVRVNALMTYDNDRDVNTFGVYAYTVTNPVRRKMLTPVRALSASGGAIIGNGKIYTYDYTVSYGYVSKAVYYTYDAGTGQVLGSRSVGSDVRQAYHEAATATAKDPVTGNVYACGISFTPDASTYGETGTYKYFLSTWDLEGMKKDSIAPLDSCLRVMAADSKGQLWGITMKSIDGKSTGGGTLVRIDKSTGAMSPIGSVGISASTYYQSAVIDPNTDIFYWFAVDDLQNANLYTVDLKTGKASLVSPLPKGDQVQGAVMAPAEAVDGAPSRPDDFKVSFPASSLEGIVSFTAPTETYSGNKLTGELQYIVTSDNDTISKGSAAAGQKVEVAVTVDNAGEHTFALSLSNSEGSGPKADTALYVGPDVPLAPANVLADKSDSGIKVTWTAPAKGVHGADLSAADLVYDVIRLNDSITIAKDISATEIYDDYKPDSLVSVSYRVVAYNEGQMSDGAISNRVIAGESLALPYAQDFTESSSLDLYTIADANNDGTTWAYYRGTVRYRSSYRKTADDWLFLPPVKLLKGNAYDLTYDVTGPSSTRYKQTLAVSMGKSTTPESQTAVLKESTDYPGNSQSTEKITIRPEEDGIYYIGFHVTSAESQGNLALDNIAVSAPMSDNGPAAVTDLKALAGDKGALSATVSFRSPSVKASGETLDDLSGFILQRDGVAIDTLKVATADVKDYSFTDNSLSKSGIYIYSVIAFNASGMSEAAADTIFVGIDTPKAPSSFIVTDNGDGTGQASWAPVTDRGVNGGYVDVSLVTYTIYDGSGNILADQVTSSPAVVSGLNTQAPQKRESFSITASSESGTSEKTISKPVITGPALTIPFAESFSNGEYDNQLWSPVSVAGKSYNKFSLRSEADQDGTGSGADYMGYTDGGQSRLESPKLDISTAEKPYLTYYVLAPAKATLALQISVNNGDWKTIKTWGENEAATWTEDSVSLEAYKSKNVRIGFLATTIKGYNYVYVDNIHIADLTASGITSIKARKGSDYDVYDILGRKVSDKITDSLPRGIYFINGRKVLIK